MANNNGILTEDKRHVRIFSEGIRIDKSLPKYTIMDENKSKSSGEKAVSNFNVVVGTPNDVYKIESLSYDVLKAFFIDQQNVANSNVTDFNLSISDKMREIAKNTSYYRNGVTFGNSTNVWYSESNGSKKNKSLWSVIKDYFKKEKEYKEEKDNSDKFDVVAFFSDVKLASDEEAKKYRNRIAEYVNCIGVAEKSGQTALKDRLFEQLVINKYESILHAAGNDKLITEKIMVDLCQKSPKALSLDYIQNYTRNIPFSVINKKIEFDKLEVFDNYVILHYDPDGTSYAKTVEERKKEVDKAKDPILFGVIAGSKKLYYIDSWEDEYCDLTFDKVVDMIGAEVVEKNYLNDKIS